MLDGRRLLALSTVAKAGSLTAAAEALSYSVPAIWQHIHRLESEVGQALVRRHARGVTLTPAGQALAAHADEILARMRLAEAELQSMEELETGSLRLASFASAGAGLLPETIAAFADAHPAVELSLVECEPPLALEKLQEGEIDLALVFAFAELRQTDVLEHTHVLDDPLYVALPAGHPLADAPEIGFRELQREPWIKGTYTVAEPDAMGESPLPIPRSKVAFQGGDFMTVQGLVAAGAGVALIPRLALHALRPDVVVRPLKGRAAARRILATTLAPPYRGSAAERFRELLLERAATVERDWDDLKPPRRPRSR
jgi:molybdate transport repressor ModE-like protein